MTEECSEKRIRQLEKELHFANRKLINAKNISEAHEQSAEEAAKKEKQSREECQCYKYKLENQEKLQALERTKEIENLDQSCQKNMIEISAIEKKSENCIVIRVYLHR